MINFFRKIRKKMADDNKPIKYMRYAIGEIVLVVIGILIALQINNWNEQRIESNEEQLILLNLKEDFEYNQKTLDSLIAYQVKSKNIQLSTLNYTGKKPKPETEKEFNIILEGLFYSGVFYPKKGALDDLISSGSLKIIKNHILRKKLSSWNPIVEQIKNREKGVSDYIAGIQILIHKKGSWLNVDNTSTSWTATSAAFPESGFDVDNRDLLNDLEFENLVETEIIQMGILTDVLKEGLKLVTEILNLLNKEIK